MITLTPSEAQDVMNGQFLTKWADGETLALIGYVPEILWQNIEKPGYPNSSQYYVRVSHQTVLEKQANLSGCEGAAGQKRYRTHGLTFVQVFCPVSDAQHGEKGLKLATIARNAFRGALSHSDNSDVWFRNARINPLPRENDIHRLNVVAEHEYDELG